MSLVTPLFFTYPALVVAVQAIRDRARPAPPLLRGLALNLAGVGLTAGTTPTTFHPLGVLFALLGGGACAAMILLAESSIRRYGEQETTRAMAAVAVPMSAAAAALFGAPLPDALPLGGWIAVLASCVLYGGSALLFFAGMRRAGAAAAASLSTLEPAVAVLAGCLLLGERPSRLALLGTALILGSLPLLEPPRPPPAAPES